LLLIEQLPAWLTAPAGHLAIAVAVALLPVLLFLGVLVRFDSFRLVRRRRVLVAMAMGACGALLSYVANTFVLDLFALPTVTFAIMVAPFIEEAIKGTWVAWQIKQGQVGFLIDAAILGFATGAGFATVENIYYLTQLQQAPLVVWVIRGLGTALMHGGTTAILGVFLQSGSKRGFARPPWVGAVFLAALFHAAFNRFMTSPVLATVSLAVTLPWLMAWVYRRGENRLRDWLGSCFDRDGELLALIRSGEVQGTPLGRYLTSLRENFRADTVADMLCLLRLQVELSIQAKGGLILREQGFDPVWDPELPGKLAEVDWLEKSIGRTGLLAMRPVCHWRGTDRWQQHLLTESSKPA